MKTYLAVDIGASSGRLVLGWLEEGRFKMREVHRFENKTEKKDGHLVWDIDALLESILEGMCTLAGAGERPVSMGIDTWAVDFALVDKAGARLGEIVAYRDSRTEGMDREVEKTLPFEELYRRTGIQKQPFNTIYQLAALQQDQPGLLERAHRLLLVPDYLHFRLTGVMSNEYTNATTTALVNAETGTWDGEILGRLGLPQHLFVPLSMPGGTLGPLSGEIQARTGLTCSVVLPATHDTGSAYLAVPARDENAAYLSSGTWSLFGMESAAPLTSEAALAANFTNEGGYGYRYRFLKNIMGLWMLQNLRREAGEGVSFGALCDMAVENEAFPSLVDVNDPAFLAPGSMAGAVAEYCGRTGQPVPQSTGETAACVYHSLAKSYAEALEELETITGRTFNAIHIVGGGSKDDHLNRLTAKATGLPVYAGPTEGTVLGNLMVQMIAGGEFSDLAEARGCLRESFQPEEYLP